MLDLEITRSVKIAISQTWLKKVVLAFNKKYPLKGKWIFSLAFVSEKTIRTVNRLYRGRDKVTDVLSFSEDKKNSLPTEGNFFGEILICTAQAERQAKKFGWPLKAEIARLLVHGLSHLAGLEHEGVSSKKEKQMIKFEKSVLESILDYKIY